MSDFIVWRPTWRKNWVNCEVLTGNSAGLRTVLSICLSHRELRSSYRESHSFLSLRVFIHHSHTHKKTHRTDRKTDRPDGKPVLCQRTFSSVFTRNFFIQLNCTVYFRVYRAATVYIKRYLKGRNLGTDVASYVRISLSVAGVMSISAAKFNARWCTLPVRKVTRFLLW